MSDVRCKSVAADSFFFLSASFYRLFSIFILKVCVFSSPPPVRGGGRREEQEAESGSGAFACFSAVVVDARSVAC